MDVSTESPDVRPWACVVLDENSPLGQIAAAVCNLTAHLPPQDNLLHCSVCASERWPCGRFDEAATAVLTARIPLAPLVPVDLHHKLWPPQNQSS